MISRIWEEISRNSRRLGPGSSARTTVRNVFKDCGLILKEGGGGVGGVDDWVTSPVRMKHGENKGVAMKRKEDKKRKKRGTQGENTLCDVSRLDRAEKQKVV